MTSLVREVNNEPRVTAAASGLHCQTQYFAASSSEWRGVRGGGTVIALLTESLICDRRGIGVLKYVCDVSEGFTVI